MHPVPAGALPNPIYRAEFLEAAMAERPSSLLDVGCGDGAFITAARARGCRAHGIDTDETGIAKLKAQGLSAEVARAEALPFGDASFDLVTFSYTTHHLADLPRAIKEALRFARRAVAILEGWYDRAVPSQRVAESYDLWSKSIDRRLGMVHNPLPTAAEIIDLIAASTDIAAIDDAHRLILAPWPIEEVRKTADEQLAALGRADANAQRALTRILDDAARDGISRDGALMMRIAKAR
jgi:SAM-dependent methyltransferase